jgi:hypothetical protein
MEPIIGGVFIILVGLGYLKYLICKCNNLPEPNQIVILQTDTIEEIPPKYDEIDNPPNYSIV